MPNRRRGQRPLIDPDLDDPHSPEPTALPTQRPDYDEEDGDRLVPLSNVGGAAPTVRGMDSGGDLPGPDDDLANLAEPEPPDSPEVGAVHVRHDEGPKSPRR